MNKKNIVKNHNIRVRVTEEEYKKIIELQKKHALKNISDTMRKLLNEGR